MSTISQTPARVESAVPAVPAAPPPESASTILIVDDDSQIRMLARACLTRAGFDVEEASGAAQALAAFQELRPSLVLCDVVMPGMDGFDLCRALRALPGGEHVPVVMMTGLEDLDSIETAFAAGATEFSIKPPNWSLLPRHLRFILKASSTQEQLRRSEERYALAARGANDGLWDWDVSSGKTYFSPRWLDLLGLHAPPGERGLEAWLCRVHRDDQRWVRETLELHLNGSEERYECEHRMMRADGEEIWVQVCGVIVRDRLRRAVRMVGSLTDISDRKSAIARLEHNALHDVLTGLPNRALFGDRLEHCMRRRHRHPDNRFAVMFIDLDRFKVINDSLGHPVGDHLLIEIGHRLSALLRQGETVARLGGDEFAVLIEDIETDDDALHIAERIHNVLRKPLSIEGHTIVVMGSIGIAFSASRYDNYEDLLRDADVAMFAAKATGSGNTEVFRQEMHVRAVRTLELERELRQALERDEITVNYQPIVGLADERIRGFEALVRWQHPVRGELLPGEFLDVACDSGLIVPMGRVVLRKACEQLRRWQQQWDEAKDWTMSVNVSARELLRDDLVEAVDEILLETGIDPCYLKIEVTESSIIENLENARVAMNALHERGICLSVDDFGTGFSSFSYLQVLPFDVLKIDRSFISGLQHRTSDSNIVRAMVRVAHELGMEVVAEGLADANSVEQLRELRCEYGQSDFFSRALNESEISSLLNSASGRDLLTGTG